MITRSLEKAKQAWKTRDVKASISAHEQKSASEHHSREGPFLKSAVYGGLDGTITTFAVVAGVAGASLNAGIVLIMGFANLIGDGISMAIGDFLSTKAENEYHKAERERESWEAKNYPEGEKKEMVELYESQGIKKKDAEVMVNTMSKYKKAWVDIMMVEELGIIKSKEDPLKNSFVTFASFCIFGLIPLMAYLLSTFIPLLKQNTFSLACYLTAFTLFLLGAAKVRITGRNWFKSGLEMVLVGGIASPAAYGIGFLLQGLA